MSDIIKSLVLCATLGLGLSHSAFAAQEGAVEVKNVAEMEVKTMKDGKLVLQREPVKKAIPDSEIVYTTTFKNIIAKPVANIVIENPIPAHSTYKAASAMGDNTLVTYSIDGGKTYALAEKLMVKGSDGKERTANPAEYTHIRWVYQNALPPGATGQVAFRSIVK